MLYSNSWYYVETSQLISKVNPLTGFLWLTIWYGFTSDYMVRVFSMECISDHTTVLLLLKVDLN